MNILSLANQINNIFLQLFLVGLLILITNCEKNIHTQKLFNQQIEKSSSHEIFIEINQKKIHLQVINGTFLGSEQRNFYGSEVPKHWNLIWKTWLGSGKTIVKKGKEEIWSGAGWTGQPLLFLENGHPYLLQGAYDHNLKKIDATNGEIIWQCPFEDVIKGTGTIWLNHQTEIPEHKALVLQGSRQSKNYFNKIAPGLKAISLLTGKPVWELNVERTLSYSRDVDASALVINDTAYIGLENGNFLVFLPDPRFTENKNNLVQPKILRKFELFTPNDALKHFRNLVIEASPAYWNRKIFISAGSGHIFTYDLDHQKIVGDFYIGSDLDGSPVITPDSCVLIAVEKQYIQGNGGILKFNPQTQAIEWYFETGNKKFASWDGGVIGSPSVKDSLCAFTAIDGYTYVVHLKKLQAQHGQLFDGKTSCPKPELIFKYHIGPSISTPLLVEDYLISAGYNGLYIFRFQNGCFQLVKKISGVFEATPFVYNQKLYIASRDGYLYCFGDL
jgi:outer membrane protein assembly factor BamB